MTAREELAQLKAALDLVTWAAEARVLHIGEPPPAFKRLVEAVLAWQRDAATAAPRSP